MKEINAIVEKQKMLAQKGIASVLATVVQIAGSAYRRPGAHMLIGEDGQTAGTISGGCLENDVMEHARKVFAGNEPLLLAYNIDDEYDKIFGTGSGCNGSIRILLEPLATKNINPLEIYSQSLKDNQRRVLITVFATEAQITGNQESPVTGQHAMLDELGNWQTEISVSQLNNLFLDEARHCLAKSRSISKQFDLPSGSCEALFEIIQAPIKLVVFGAGDDVLPLVTFANQLGWQISIVDPRPAFATASRFAACNSVHCLRPEEISREISLDERTAIVLMSHNFQFDLAVLKNLKDCFTHSFQLKYLGILGPKKRTNELFAELTDLDRSFWQEKIISLNFPIGLDLGAETPQEIALSIVSEIQTIFAHEKPQPHVDFLKNRQGPIHPQSESSVNQKLAPTENIPCPLIKEK